MSASTIEKHFQTVLQIIVAALISWFGFQVVEQGKSVARMEVVIESLNKELMQMRTNVLTQVDDRYRRAEAVRDQELLRRQIAENQERITRLENLMQQYLDSRIK